MEREIAERREVETALTRATIQLEERNRELAILSRSDQLTGLFNRRFLDEIIDLLLSSGRDADEFVFIALCDVDDFKQVNDRLSHTVGDDVLRMVADILRTTLRRTDMAVRYGGEEFVVVFPNTDEDTAALLMDQFRVAVAGYNWGLIDESLRVTVSTGVAMQATHPDGYSLIQDADKCLYRAKHRGKNQVIVATQACAEDVPTSPFLLSAK